MADHSQRVAGVFDPWFEELDRTKEDLTSRRTLQPLLGSAAAAEDYELLAGKLKELRARADAVSRAAEVRRKEIERLRDEWAAARRWTPIGLQELAREIAGKLPEPGLAANRWLLELFDAIDLQEWDAVEGIAGLRLRWPPRLLSGVESIRRELSAWRSGEIERGLELMRTLGAEESSAPALGRWTPLRAEVRSRALRLAAWIALRQRGDKGEAETHLDEAVKLFPNNGRMHAERAAYFLFLPDFDRAAHDAQRAIENAGHTANGYLELGIWSELNREYDAADDLFRRGLEGMPSFEIARLPRRAALIDPPGRLLMCAAEVLFNGQQFADALKVAEAALIAGVRGGEPHPRAPLYRLQSQLLQELRDGAVDEAAAIALKAGKLYLWNGDPQEAIKQFLRAEELDPTLEEAGWLVADALIAESLPLGEVVPNRKKIERAREAWDARRDKAPPAGDCSWAYHTRAIIADLESQRPDSQASRADGIWSAMAFVERALIHDDSDAQRWGAAAQYLRYAQLEALALEASEEGERLSPQDRRVLAERLTLLARRGPLDEAEEVAETLVAIYGHDPLVGAIRAQIELRREHYERVPLLLELPLAEGNNPIWYLELLTLGHLGCGEAEGAKEACTKMMRDAETNRAPAIDGSHKCALSTAATMLGQLEAASDFRKEARRDATARPSELHRAEAWLGAARGRMAASRQSLEAAVLAAGSDLEIADIRQEVALRAPLLDSGLDGLADQLADAARAAESKRADLAREPHTADTELAAALASLERRAVGDELGLRGTALVAVAGRREMRGGNYVRAATHYERLRRASFEPEATIGLIAALQAESERMQSAGDPDRVIKLQKRLTELDAVAPVEQTLNVASVLGAAGRRGEARERLRAYLAKTENETERAAIHEGLARLAAEAGDWQNARAELVRAREIVGSHGRSSNQLGRLQIWLALVACLQRDQEDVARNLELAVEAWRGIASDVADVVVSELVRLADDLAPDPDSDLSRRVRSSASAWRRTLRTEAARMRDRRPGSNPAE